MSRSIGLLGEEPQAVCRQHLKPSFRLYLILPIPVINLDKGGCAGFLCSLWNT